MLTDLQIWECEVGELDSRLSLHSLWNACIQFWPGSGATVSWVRLLSRSVVPLKASTRSSLSSVEIPGPTGLGNALEKEELLSAHDRATCSQPGKL